MYTHKIPKLMGRPCVRFSRTNTHELVEAAQDEAPISGEAPPLPHPIIYSAINRKAIRDAALNTQDAAGPSGMDAASWRRICTAFQGASDELCDALASCACRLASSSVDPVSLEAFLACRLMPLDKQPGVRPIGIGEVVRRIIGKAILKYVSASIQQSVGCLQMCGGQACDISRSCYPCYESGV